MASMSRRRNVPEKISPGLFGDEHVPISRPDHGVNQLPAEILSHIFMLGTEDTSEDEIEPKADDDSRSKSYGQTHFATLCSHVCGYWRDTAIETPQLWNSIDFAEGFPFEKSQEWISRSKAVPLDLDIEHTENSSMPLISRPLEDDAIKSTITTIASLIMPHAHRWLSLNISADLYDIIWLWQKQLQACPATPCLETLAFFCYEDCPDKSTFFPTDLRTPLPLSLETPRLKFVTLWGVHIDWEATKFLKNLKSLKFAYHTLDVGLSTPQFIRLLNDSPYLEELYLEDSAPTPGAWPYERIVLNSLHTISLVGIDVAAAISIVKHLDFPVLRDLTLDLEEDFSSVENFVAIVCKGDQPRFREVEALKLTSFSCHRPQAIRFLKSMPKLSSINFNFNFLNQNFYRAFVDKHQDYRMVCPKLDTLKLSGLGDSELRSLVQARMRSKELEPVRRLYLDVDDDIGDETINWLNGRVELLEFYATSDYETDEEGDDEDDEDDEDEEEYYSDA